MQASPPARPAPPIQPAVLAVRGPLWAVFKPSGWAMHPAGPETGRALTDWLETQAPGLRPAHRLDRGTSGVVLCSADPATRGAVGKAFEAGRVHKTYLTLVHGRTRRKGILRRALSDGRRGRPLPAVTRYTLVRWLGPFSLVRVRPETGRKHQIRRHLAQIGHPVVGDSRWGRTGPPPAGAPDRLWLHAAGLTLEASEGLAAWDVACPLPAELQAHVDALEAQVAADRPDAAGPVPEETA